MRTKIYTVYLSNKQSIVIDQQDFDKLFSAGESKMVKLKKGIINPSFVVCILFKEEIDSKIELDGHIDEKTRKFVVTKQTEVATVTDDFEDVKRNALEIF